MGFRKNNWSNKPKRTTAVQTDFSRVRLPYEGEILGIVIALMGGTRLLVNCKDGKERMCRIPGKLRKKIWVRDGDVIIVKPGDIEADKKADVIWRYNQIQVNWLKKKGIL
ncbi:MAG: translation initiation factor eIF-1A [Candidatus Micrarchaeia archaeon]